MNRAVPPKKTLVVIIHGFRGSTQSMDDLKNLAELCYPDAEILVETYPHSSIFSTTKAAEIVRQILIDISKAYDRNPFKRLILIGHSVGAVLARRVVVEASGLETAWERNNPDGNPDLKAETKLPEKPEYLKIESELSGNPKYDWAEFIDTLIMMASVSRGWSIENAKSGVQKLQWNIGAIIGHLLPNQLKPTLFDFRKGSPFIVQTRLRWIQYCQNNSDTITQTNIGENRLKLVQFLGTLDELVPPNDSIDFASPPERVEFQQIEIPDTNHKNVTHLFESQDASQSENEARATREKIVGAVLKNEVDDYRPYVVSREQLHDELPPEPDTQTENLVFVVHGIRDKGYWTKKIAGRIKNSAKARNLKFASRTPSYGYFPILPFLLPWYRRQKIEWLMDNYVEASSSYPKAAFHFMGHSNGTYLCARALLDYPSASFKHIMFAGSVVRPDFEWKPLVESGKVSKIFNALATKDWVVAVFTHGLRHFQCLFDLGGAGHVGFKEKGIPNSLFQLDIGNQQLFVKGGHSAAREEQLWDEIADFIVEGSQPIIPNVPVDRPTFATEQPPISILRGKLAPFFVYLLGGTILGIGSILLFTLLLDMGVGDLFGNSPDPTNGSIWSRWLTLGFFTHLLILGAYFFSLRFMAIRF